MFLSDLKTGEEGIIIKVNGRGAFRKRIVEMGFIKGKLIKSILNAPLSDPVKYEIMNYEVSLRKSEAALIEVKPVDSHNLKEQSYLLQGDVHNTGIDAFKSSDDFFSKKTIRKTSKSKEITIALVGNPNAGKTSLFNIAVGAHEHVGNYSGVTVDAKIGKVKYKDYILRIVDLPGTYSLSAYTMEELYVRNHIVVNKPDVIVNIVAASNIERNLYLTSELIDLSCPVVVALNMYDELQDSGSQLDVVKLSELTGLPIIPTVAKTGQGVHDLFDAIIELFNKEVKQHTLVNIYYGNLIENSISRINIQLQKIKLQYTYPTRYIAIKLLEKDKDMQAYIQQIKDGDELLKLSEIEIVNIEKSASLDTETIFVDSRYTFVDKLLKKTFIEKKQESPLTAKIDKYTTNKYLGFPIFIVFMLIMFECTFQIGGYPKDWIQNAVDALGAFVKAAMPAGMLKDLIADGIIAGVGGVIVFLPNILILYAFISFMEDSGYMSRAAFIMDKVMRKIGLHGKSFIPLVMGFGCNVPAIMSTRTIESRSRRMITILISPFMSCSARLPVYLLFVGIFFKSYAGLALFGLYFIGILFAVISALLFKSTLFPKEDKPFVMELPPYRVPTLRSVLIHMWDKSKQYLKKMGGVILLASIIIWFLGYFPRTTKNTPSFNNQISKIETNFNAGKITKIEKNQSFDQITLKENIDHQENSYIGKIGHFIEPVIRPLGFDWRLGVGLLSGMAAKEVIVSTFSVLYTGNSDDSQALHTRLHSAKRPNGLPVFTPLVVIGLLLFILIYFPCIATLAAITTEAGSWKWGLFSIFYTVILAWLVSFLIYQIGSLF